MTSTISREFLVECYSPGDTVEAANGMLAALGAHTTRCVGCLAVPMDDTCLFVFESGSRPQLEHSLVAAGIDYERIVEVVRICPGDAPGYGE